MNTPIIGLRVVCFGFSFSDNTMLRGMFRVGLVEQNWKIMSSENSMLLSKVCFYRRCCRIRAIRTSDCLEGTVHLRRINGVGFKSTKTPIRN